MRRSAASVRASATSSAGGVSSQSYRLHHCGFASRRWYRSIPPRVERAPACARALCAGHPSGSASTPSNRPTSYSSSDVGTPASSPESGASSRAGAMSSLTPSLAAQRAHLTRHNQSASWRVDSTSSRLYSARECRVTDSSTWIPSGASASQPRGTKGGEKGRVEAKGTGRSAPSQFAYTATDWSPLATSVSRTSDAR